jgi:hypothetical protein
MDFEALRKVLAIKSYCRNHPMSVLRDLILLSQRIDKGVAANDQQKG